MNFIFLFLHIRWYLLLLRAENFFVLLNLKYQLSCRLLQIAVFQLKTANLFTGGIAEYSLGKTVFAGLKK